MDQARVLVRSVVRAFYETEHVVLIDALVFHSALSLADLALVLDLGKQTKAVQKLCGRLKEGGLISVFARQETREGAQKPTTREYYYIDYRRAIDAIKYRIHRVDESIKTSSKPTTEKKEFVCPQCKAQWSLMEVLDCVDVKGRGSGFYCRTCEAILDNKADKDDDEPEQDDTLAQFNKQFGPFLSLLQQVDDAIIPAVTGESALADARPLPRDEELNPLARSIPVSEPIVRPTAVKGITSGPEKIEVSLTTSSESKAADYAVETERRARVAAQNQLPEWHTKSTVTGELTGKGKGEDGAGREQTLHNIPLKHGDDDDEDKTLSDPALDAYFAALKEEQERQAKEDAEEEESEDEDDDEFEDIIAPPVATNGDAEEPDSKRVKVEDSAKVAAVDTPAGEESDEDEFEDAL